MATHNFRVLTPAAATKVIFETLSNPFTFNERILLHSEPGIGKTTIMRRVAKMMGATLIPLHLLTIDPGAMRGLERIITNPKTGEVETHPARPYFLPAYVADEDITDETPIYIIFLDEIMAADDIIRKAAFELLTESRVGPHLIGKNVRIVGAGNSAEDGTIVYEMDRATRDRFNHIKLESDQDGLIDYGTEQGWHHHVIAFIRQHADAILPSDEDRANDNLAAPSPRSHEAVSNQLKAFDAGYISVETRDTLICGKLGNWAGDLLIEAIEDEESRFDTLSLVESKPEDRVYPTTPFGAFSLAGALNGYATDPEKLDKAIDVMLCMPNHIHQCVEESKTTFIHDIGDKLRQWRLYPKYSRDARVLPFLAETQDLIDEADRAYEEQQAMQQSKAA